ncbi:MULTISPECIES: response regulator transcription factor [Streptomyces]|uniref:Two component transcriptional regulator, winged helix family n=1 Tax=Streptomyces venezuelae (strain ATCC 10712 / CBS 650.69 / DSM 40230 / JCM 4526 / NBRC 13096 / PD 04745) TaxID=953739 RepID=F2R2D3_STRVP|nr:response regulator transcription factor [Streptomyces venezuelae]APE21630.1 DNA-binding response regulator [Streptomyces venezuelae]QER99013.1 DNA-binding response regulator [Streptomyces venezuelae ATCC 10712]QES06102.1 DNA-binding response regulator [Streptomyces venezuelae]CCA55682.1 two component transcriptional regulator, winged helix family [Streptomyces venezuelae ATCC 10712]
MTRLLVVEDDPDLGLALRVLLARRGYEVSVAEDGREGLRLLFAERPALMILDLLLPELDGWQVLDRTRDMSDLPVLVLSGLGDVDDRVRGLRSGADDYLVKPFAHPELLARVDALLRRSGPGSWAGESVGEDLRLVPERRAALWQGSEIRLSDIEYRLLQLLVRNRGRVVTTEQLLDQVWDDPTSIGRDRVKFAVLRLRRKLRTAGGPASRDPLEAIRGLGYRYDSSPDGRRAR